MKNTAETRTNNQIKEAEIKNAAYEQSKADYIKKLGDACYDSITLSK